MRIREQTESRLVMVLGVPLVASVHCEFDKARGEARIRRSSFGIPLKAHRVSLAEVRAVDVERQEARTGEAVQVIHFPILRLAGGPVIRLGGFGEAGAEAAAGRIRAFLGLASGT